MRQYEGTNWYLLKFNIALEQSPFPKGKQFSNHDFAGAMLIFRGVVKVDTLVTCVLIRVVARIPMIEGTTINHSQLLVLWRSECPWPWSSLCEVGRLSILNWNGPHGAPKSWWFGSDDDFLSGFEFEGDFNCCFNRREFFTGKKNCVTNKCLLWNMNEPASRFIIFQSPPGLSLSRLTLFFGWFGSPGFRIKHLRSYYVQTKCIDTWNTVHVFTSCKCLAHTHLSGWPESQNLPSWHLWRPGISMAVRCFASLPKVLLPTVCC